MSDADFLAAFESASLTESHHRDHIRMTWLYLRRGGLVVGARRVGRGIERFAAARGATTLYNETLTRLWIRLLAAALAADGGADSFEDFARVRAELLDKEYAFTCYRRETLTSAEARAGWVEPDLALLP